MSVICFKNAYAAIAMILIGYLTQKRPAKFELSFTFLKAN